jgi:hypothetical protein
MAFSAGLQWRNPDFWGTLSIRGCESKQQPIVMFSKSLASFTGTDFYEAL